MLKERKFPSRCPGCRRLLADSAKTHCPPRNRHCPWLLCACGQNIAQEK